MYDIFPMPARYAKEIASWNYPSEYSIYSFENDQETVNELMNGEYFARADRSKRLIGYFCFGKSAQILLPIGSATPHFI